MTILPPNSVFPNISSSPFNVVLAIVLEIAKNILTSFATAFVDGTYVAVCVAASKLIGDSRYAGVWERHKITGSEL